MRRVGRMRSTCAAGAVMALALAVAALAQSAPNNALPRACHVEVPDIFQRLITRKADTQALFSDRTISRHREDTLLESQRSLLPHPHLV